MRQPFRPVSEWVCLQCGLRTATNIVLYRNDIHLQPQVNSLDPSCAECGDRIQFQKGRHPRSISSSDKSPGVIVVNGTCASGKTTISHQIAEQYGFVQLDGDWILKKHKLEHQRSVDFNDIHEEIIVLTQGLLFFGKSVVISHLIRPRYMQGYQSALQHWTRFYRMVILMPQYTQLLTRNAERKSWTRTTPEYWVMMFYQEFSNASHDVQAMFYDNSYEHAAQTTSNIIRMFQNISGAEKVY